VMPAAAVPFAQVHVPGAYDDIGQVQHQGSQSDAAMKKAEHETPSEGERLDVDYQVTLRRGQYNWIAVRNPRRKERPEVAETRQVSWLALTLGGINRQARHVPAHAPIGWRRGRTRGKCR
jgi:hypothetical protein